MGKTETWKGDKGEYNKISSPDQFHSYFEISERV